MGYSIDPNFFYEIINITYVCAILFYSRKKFVIADIQFIILFIHFILIFLTNYVLFNPGYISDQFKYLFTARMYRGSSEMLGYFPSPTVNTAGVIFAFFPLPIINSVYSTAMINFIFFLFAYIFLKQKDVFTNFSEYFYLLFPSLALYSALGGRDIIICFLMILFFYYFLIEKRRIIPIIIVFPLILLKFQNAAILLMMVFIYYLLDIKNLKLSVLLILIIVAFIFFIRFSQYLNLKYINNLRYFFIFYENPEMISEYFPFNSWGELAVFSFTAVFKFLLEPFIWEADSFFKLFQSVENVIIAFMITYSIFRYFNRSSYGKIEKRFINIYFILSMLIYAMVIVNPGVAARYRFTFVVTYFIFHSFFREEKKDNVEETKNEEYYQLNSV